MGPQRRRVLSPPPRSYRPRSATPPLCSLSSLVLPAHQESVSLGLSQPSPAPEALPRPGVPDPSGRRTRIPPLGSGTAHRLPRDRARLGTARRSPAAAASREPIPTWHRTRCSFFAQLQPGERPAGGLGAPSPSPTPRVREGAGVSRGEGGKRARGWVGMDNQHLGRNSSRWFPPCVSQGSETGPCEQEGGSERRVCVRARTGRPGRLFPPAKEMQPRGNGAERIIKARKRSWERRGGAWGGGFTRAGSYYTVLGASFPRVCPSVP